MTSKKTKTKFVVPPYENMLIEIFKKWNGLPPKKNIVNLNAQTRYFNTKMRLLLKDIGFDEISEEPIYHHDFEENKKKHGLVPKWMGFSSHACRRSCATNLSIQQYSPTEITAMMGWKDFTMLNHYNKMNATQKTATMMEKARKLNHNLQAAPKATRIRPTKVQVIKSVEKQKAIDEAPEFDLTDFSF